MKRIVVFALLSVLTSGCGAPGPSRPSREEWEVADFGPKPDAKEATNRWIEETFLDPDSAKIYTIDEPQKTCCHSGLLNSPTYGWSWFVDVNSKNRFGGYVGRTIMRVYAPFKGQITSSKVLSRHFGEDNADGKNSGVQWYFREEHVDAPISSTCPICGTRGESEKMARVFTENGVVYVDSERCVRKLQKKLKLTPNG